MSSSAIIYMQAEDDIVFLPRRKGEAALAQGLSATALPLLFSAVSINLDK